MAPLIGLDLAFLQPGATGGMETYARALVPALHAARSDLRFVAFAGRELAAELKADPWVPDLTVVPLPLSSGWRFRRVALEQTVEAARIAKARPDLVHALGNTAPLAPLGAPLVTTVHDVIWARHPETVAPALRLGVGPLVRGAVRRSTKVIAVSHATKDDLTDLLRTPPAKVDVVPNGVAPPATAPTPEPELRAEHDLPDGPLVLCPAPPRPHKNVARLAQAMAGLDATLVVPGYAAVGVGDDLDVPGARVRRLGWVTDADLEGLYAASTLLAYPSLAEGFGLPVLEAMQRGLPVACSATTSLPEVAGDAAELFDPTSTEAMRQAVAKLLARAELRQELAARGRAQAARFTWEATARGTLATYDRVLAPDG